MSWMKGWLASGCLVWCSCHSTSLCSVSYLTWLAVYLIAALVPRTFVGWISSMCSILTQDCHSRMCKSIEMHCMLSSQILAHVWQLTVNCWILKTDFLVVLLNNTEVRIVTAEWLSCRQHSFLHIAIKTNPKLKLKQLEKSELKWQTKKNLAKLYNN